MKFKSLVAVVISAVVCHGLAAGLPCATPESQGVSSDAVSKWVEAAHALDSVHSFVLVRHGKVIAQGA